jgi:DUF4097 and DUF4098 domain-containing protein YvlB
MKRNFLFFICCFFNYQVFCQSFSIANEKMNVLYAGVDNPISFAVEKTASSKLIIKTNNGIIRKVLNDYIVVPATIGSAEITLYKKVQSKEILIAKKEFRVKKISTPSFKIGSGRSRVPMEEIANQKYVRASIEDIDYDFPILEIESFKVTINYKDTSIAPITITNKSNKIKDEIIQYFFLLKKGDIIFFSEIFANSPWEKHMTLDDATVQIL